jgi:hypothetical protein
LLHSHQKQEFGWCAGTLLLPFMERRRQRWANTLHRLTHDANFHNFAVDVSVVSEQDGEGHMLWVSLLKLNKTITSLVADGAGLGDDCATALFFALAGHPTIQVNGLCLL